MIDPPGEHPKPPGDLASRTPLLVTFGPGKTFSRIHGRNYPPIFFGSTGGNRFDSADHGFGVLYLGLDEFCAFIETFGQSTGNSSVTRSELEGRCLSYLTITKPLTVIDLASSGSLARIGADSRLFSGSHAIAQRWSAALRPLPTKPAGILYPARHDPARSACALFDLPESTFEVTSAGSLLEPKHAGLLGQILDLYEFGLIDE
jgi:RES domain